MRPRPEGNQRAALETPGPWSEAAACRGLDPAIWYPTRPDADEAERAKRFCRTCVVQEPCLDLALTNREPFGVWGGVDEEGRRLLLRARSVMEEASVMEDPAAEGEEAP